MGHDWVDENSPAHQRSTTCHSPRSPPGRGCRSATVPRTVSSGLKGQSGPSMTARLCRRHALTCCFHLWKPAVALHPLPTWCATFVPRSKTRSCGRTKPRTWAHRERGSLGAGRGPASREASSCSLDPASFGHRAGSSPAHAGSQGSGGRAEGGSADALPLVPSACLDRARPIPLSLRRPRLRGDGVNAHSHQQGLGQGQEIHQSDDQLLELERALGRDRIRF
jgi:hypothetical protein